MHFKFYGSEMDIESKDWVDFTAAERITLKVGQSSIDIRNGMITITGPVTIDGEVRVNGHLSASSIDED
jgi:uncharacterized protein (DUF2345 family)